MNLKKIFFGLLVGAIFASVGSQVEEIKWIARPLTYVLWFSALICCVVLRRKRLNVSHFTVYFGAAFAIFILNCLILALLGTNHLQSSFLRLMWIPIAMSVIGSNMYCLLEKQQIKKLLNCYCLCAIIYAIVIHVTFFSSFQAWLNTTVYLFDDKNSAAQIWATAILIIIFQLRNQTQKERLFWGCGAIYLMLLIGLSQCRTAILGLAAASILFIFIKMKHPFFLAFTLSVCLFAVYQIPEIRSFVNQIFMFNKYRGASLDTISSGRITLIKKAMEAVSSNLFFGVGTWYVDCLPVQLLAETGILGFTLFGSVWTFRAVNNLRGFISKQRFFLPMLTVYYIVTSLLEAYPPFGPGACSFMFWMLSEMDIEPLMNSKKD